MDAPILADPQQVVEGKQGMKERQSNDYHDPRGRPGNSRAEIMRVRASIKPNGIRLF